jgi:dihydroorotase
MKNIVIKNVSIVNEGTTTTGDVWIRDTRIEKIGSKLDPSMRIEEIDGTGQTLIPGVIDDQVHFREPGLTHKATIYTEAKAAVRGGVTSFMEMPNTNPPAFTHELLEQKYDIAKNHALANYSFFMGTSNDNLEEILRTNDKKKDICGVKIFMGSSTGNLLVDNPILLEKIFEGSEVLIATHCEEERLIKQNLAIAAAENRKLTAADHPIIRDEEVCFESSFRAVQMAKKFGTRLHILHITTAKELQLFSNMLPLEEKRITSEVCVHHLHFTSDDYAKLGNQIKCNPAIKAPNNKTALWEGLLDNRLDIIATDHAPHTWAEKQEDYMHAHAGLPLVQHALGLMLHYVAEQKITIERVVEKMSHAPARCFQINNRGYIREGYFADLVLLDRNTPETITKENILYKCGWSPLEDFTQPATVSKTFVNGHMVYGNGGFDESKTGMRLQFNRS